MENKVMEEVQVNGGSKGGKLIKIVGGAAIAVVAGIAGVILYKNKKNKVETDSEVEVIDSDENVEE